MSTVTPFVPTRDSRWQPPNPTTRKPNRFLTLARSFANPHDAAHLAICGTVCTLLHFALERIL